MSSESPLDLSSVQFSQGICGLGYETPVGWCAARIFKDGRDSIHRLLYKMPRHIAISYTTKYFDTELIQGNSCLYVNITHLRPDPIFLQLLPRLYLHHD